MIERLSAMSPRAKRLTQTALLAVMVVMIPVVYWLSYGFGSWVGTN